MTKGAMTKGEFRDLARLARERTRESASLVLQLLDDDVAKSQLLIALALDLITGASAFLHDADSDSEDPMNEQEAMASCVVALLGSIDVNVMEAAYQRMRKRREKKEQPK
jgi:hypothetical protein